MPSRERYSKIQGTYGVLGIYATQPQAPQPVEVGVHQPHAFYNGRRVASTVQLPMGLVRRDTGSTACLPVRPRTSMNACTAHSSATALLHVSRIASATEDANPKTPCMTRKHLVMHATLHTASAGCIHRMHPCCTTTIQACHSMSTAALPRAAAGVHAMQRTGVVCATQLSKDPFPDQTPWQVSGDAAGTAC